MKELIFKKAKTGLTYTISQPAKISPMADNDEPSMRISFVVLDISTNIIRWLRNNRSMAKAKRCEWVVSKRPI